MPDKTESPLVFDDTPNIADTATPSPTDIFRTIRHRYAERARELIPILQIHI